MNNPTISDEEENVRVVTKDSNVEKLMPTGLSKNQSGNAGTRFVRRYPILFVLIMSVLIVIVVLAIVLPLTLVKPKAERPIKPQCSDGKFQPRIDCLPDKNNLLLSGVSLDAACRQRGCCWSSAPEGGGPPCSYHVNFGFRKTKVKESGSSGFWYELTRMEAPSSMARSDISNLEFKLEMHTDYRLRIKVNFIFFNLSTTQKKHTDFIFVFLKV